MSVTVEWHINRSKDLDVTIKDLTCFFINLTLLTTSKTSLDFTFNSALSEAGRFSSSVMCTENSNFYSPHLRTFYLKFVITIYRIYHPFGGPWAHPDYWDTLRFWADVFLDKYFTLDVNSLSSEYMTLQLFKIRNRRMQHNWIKTNIGFNQYFMDVPQKTAIGSLNYTNIVVSSLEIVGRAANLKKCLRSRFRVWGGTLNRTNPWTIIGYYGSLYSRSFISRWGVVNIWVNYNTLYFK